MLNLIDQCFSTVHHNILCEMPPRSKDGITFSGAWISWAHTVVAYTAFLGALITGLCLHYHKIVENEYYVRSHSRKSR